MTKIKLAIDATDIEEIQDLSDVHYRIIYRKSENLAVVACVQDFDYYDYDEFIGDVRFAHEDDAERAAKKINKIGVKHFRTFSR